ncbi:exonuclease RNAse T and DNA polymerase [Nostoc phage A1]|nr:exonuclease RNAse T and DNA polymerase [Nostoc phage A1]
MITNIGKYNEAIATLTDLSISGQCVFLDTETIGDFSTPVLVQLAVVDVEKRPVFDSYIHPWYTPDTIKLNNGCDWTEIEKAYDFESHYEVIKSALADRDILIYNKSFDIRVIKEVCEFYELPLPFDPDRVYCLMSLRSAIVGDKLPLEGKHTALEDCIVMVDLFRELCKYEPIDAIAGDNLAEICIKYDQVCAEIKQLESLKSEYAAFIKSKILSDVTPGDSTTIEIKHGKKQIKVSGRVDTIAKVDDPSLVPEKYFKQQFDRFAAAKDFKESGELAPGVTYERSEILGKIVIADK